jgi:hypothetical protein
MKYPYEIIIIVSYTEMCILLLGGVYDRWWYMLVVVVVVHRAGTQRRLCVYRFVHRAHIYDVVYMVDAGGDGGGDRGGEGTQGGTVREGP